MKTALGPLLILLFGALLAMAFNSVGASMALRASVGEHNVSGTMRHSGFSSDMDNGIFIMYNQNDVKKANDSDIFYGNVGVEDDIIKDLRYTLFKYEAVKSIGGVWYTAQEYAEYLGQQNTSVVPWMLINWGWDERIDENQPGKVLYPDNNCEWQLRVKSAPGKYGIRARAAYEVTGFVDVTQSNGTVITQRAQWFEYHRDANNDFVDFFFTILYGDAFNYVKCTDTRMGSVHVVKDHGRNVKINISANEGAMRVPQNELGDYIKTKSNDLFTAGTIDEPLDITWANIQNITIDIRLNGNNVNWAYHWVPGGIELNIPNNAARGRYHIAVTYRPSMEAAKPDVVLGSYVIDNGNPVPKMTSTRGAGIAFIVIGLVGLFCGTALFIGPRLAYSVNQARYKNIDDKIYKVDAKSIREKEKAAKLAREQKKAGTTPAKDGAAAPGTPVKSSANQPRSFTSRMNDYRMQREKAAQQGITMEEMREQERVQKKVAETSKFGMGDVRRAAGEQVKIVVETPITEDAPVTKRTSGQPEIDLLDSVKQESAFASDQFMETAVRSNIGAADGQDLTADQQNTPDTGGFLSRIRNFTGDEDEEKK